MKNNLPSILRHRLIFLSLLAVPIAVAGSAAQSVADGILIQNGQKVAFLGDSITSQGWELPAGYVKLVVSGLAANGVKVVPIPAGVSGNKSNDMLNRLDNDVISKKPDWMTISCGVNDVWHGAGGIPLPAYKQNITKIIDKAQAAGIKVIILTSTMIGEDDNGNNQKLAGYNAFLRELAKEKNFPLADLNADMHAIVAADIAKGRKPEHLITVDGVHMNPRGNIMMATGILKAMGLSDDELAKAHEAWLDMPNAWTDKVTYQFSADKNLTLRQYLQLEGQLSKDAPGVPELLQSLFNQDVQAVLAPNEKSVDKIKTDIQAKFNRDLDERLKK